MDILADAALRFPDALFLTVEGTEKYIGPYREAARTKGADNFVMIGLVPQDEVSSYLLSSNILVLPYSSDVTIEGGTESGKFTIPLKIFEYMAAGKPILATKIPSVMEVLDPKRNSVAVR